uniref:Uncharacterized protein n=1 Tax=Triticum urartu TaxID=4572 RepID=A0A8R7R0I5_TRIUA
MPKHRSPVTHRHISASSEELSVHRINRYFCSMVCQWCLTRARATVDAKHGCKL